MTVLANKTEMYPLLRNGALGNTMQTWDSVAECLESGFQGKVALRYRGSGNRRFWVPDIEPIDMVKEVANCVKLGADPTQLYVCEFLNVQWIELQAVLARSEAYLDLTYSTVKLPLRESLAVGGINKQGVEAVVILRHYLDPAYYDLLLELFESYDDSITEPRPVIEFSITDRPVGIYDQRLIIWEISSNRISRCQLPNAGL